MSRRRIAGAIVVAALSACVVLAAPAHAQEPFDELGTCVGNKPGPEPGGTVLQLCVPRLVKAWADNGLVPVPEAKRLQPIPVGRLSYADQTGDPPKLLLRGGVRLLGGLTLRNRDRVPITTRIDVIYWDGRAPTALAGHRRLRLVPGTRLRVRGHTVVKIGAATLRLRTVRVTEDD